jgi:prepilin-type N-terminal cleavage/methylation domain-containing protein
MRTHMQKQKIKKSKEGFTLLELLIVITIIAILSVALVFVLNPAETLAKSRDTQRMSDLSTLKTALGIYLTSSSTPQLDGSGGTLNDKCDGGTAASERLWISVSTASETTNDATPPGGWTQANTSWGQTATVASSTLVNGTGWIPVKLSGLVGGSPISSMPLDPVNRIAFGASAVTTITNEALMYRYACKKSPLSFEVDARLESSAYGVGGTDDKAKSDGGNNTNLFEVGTDMTILPGTNDF